MGKKINFPKLPFSDLLPSFIIAEHRGIILSVPLPLDFRKLVPRFYERKGRESVENYVESIEKLVKDLGNALEIDARLTWSDRLGLINISIGINGDLELDENKFPPRFVGYNSGFYNSSYVGMIAMNYVKTLYRLNEQ